MGVFRPDLYVAALGRNGKAEEAANAIGAFAGPPFNPDDIAEHLAAFSIRHRKA
jgi:NitT/TauT family transport system ATP-binding protein